MQMTGQTISVDAALERLQSENEVDCAIDTVVTFAFGTAEPIDRYLFRIRSSLPPQPTVKELVEAVFDTRRELGPIPDEPARRADAAMAMAAFLSADPNELGIPAAMFRVGAEVWLTPARAPLS
ncbi:MAG TPA: hypothetical protein VMK42_13525 [Anaeromyxobacteraceae bacterium]|nr:hypothetical protein [Anaeromyxobacteraceae bacterium]